MISGPIFPTHAKSHGYKIPNILKHIPYFISGTCMQMYMLYMCISSIQKKSSTLTPKFPFRNSKRKIYFAEFLEKLRYTYLQYLLYVNLIIQSAVAFLPGAMFFPLY